MSSPVEIRRHGNRLWRAGAGALFLASALLATWPLALHMGRSIPRGTEPAATVPLFNLWTIWWNGAWPAADARGYWDAPIFAPHPAAFALSEPQPATMLVAPLQCLGAPPALGFNIYLLLALWLNGVATRQLLRRAGLGEPAAIGGGLFVQWLPFTHWQLGVLQLIPLFGEAWAILAMIRLVERPTLGRGAGLGLALAVSWFTCCHHALFFAVLLAASGGWLIASKCRSREFWRSLTAGVAVASVLIGPGAVSQYRLLRAERFQRGPEWDQQLSLQAGDLATTFHSPLPVERWIGMSPQGRWPASPGWVKCVLAAIGAVVGLGRAGRRRWTLFALTWTCAAALLAMGPNFRIGSAVPWEWLRSGVPGFEHVRNVFRFGLFAQLGVAWLAAGGIDALVGGFRERSDVTSDPDSARRRFPARRMVAAVAIVLGCVECWPLPQRLLALPSRARGWTWVDAVRERTPPDALLACLPFPVRLDVADFETETWWMFHQRHHGRALLNGYSGYFPDSYRELREGVQTFPDASSVERLGLAGATALAVDRQRVPDGGVELAGGGFVYERIFEGGIGGVDVYLRRDGEGRFGEASGRRQKGR
ncbi:MAG: DUF2029 domain-containing protein [Planctomyces sp.]|nr:DUF2029 domain-containing protein [Planctomyces sp.]